MTKMIRKYDGPLTDAKCRVAVCIEGQKNTKYGDSGGLYLQVSPARVRDGANTDTDRKASAGVVKRWFLKYKKKGSDGWLVESRMSLGSYPKVSLAQARTARDDAKKVKASGSDPVQERKAVKLRNEAKKGDTFAEVVHEYMEIRSPDWSASHRDRCQRIITRDLLPKLGGHKMCDITPPELVAVLRIIERRNTLGVLSKARALCSSIWGFAHAAGKANSNIASGLRKVFKTAPERHFPAITDPDRFGVLLRHIKAYQGGAIVRAALQLSPLLFQRPGELRAMTWAEVDLDMALWTIPSERMKREKAGKKNGSPHLVPLSRQAVQILRGLHPYTGHGVMVFPSERDHERPMSDNSIRTALMSLGFSKEEHTAHGFRASARTMLAERLNFDPLIIEAQLAHAVQDALGKAYNRTLYLDQRTSMMQSWADYCDKLSAGNVIDFSQKRQA